jgi:hypothetical protein
MSRIDHNKFYQIYVVRRIWPVHTLKRNCFRGCMDSA